MKIARCGSSESALASNRTEILGSATDEQGNRRTGSGGGEDVTRKNREGVEIVSVQEEKGKLIEGREWGPKRLEGKKEGE